MPATRKSSTRGQKARAAIFDAAVARGLFVPDGIKSSVRDFFVQHGAPWTEQDAADWRAHMLDQWESRQSDPKRTQQRLRIVEVLSGTDGFAKLRQVELLCPCSAV